MFIRSILLLAALLSLGACGTMRQARLTPLPQATVDPDDTVLRTALKNYLTRNGQPVSSEYEYVRRDLDGDGRRDAIVLFENPFYSWCSSEGCRMVVFRASDNDFAALSQIAPVRGPLLVSDTKTRGWNDLIVRVSGRMNVLSKNVALKFDGQSYPSLPVTQPALPSILAMADFHGTEIFP